MTSVIYSTPNDPTEKKDNSTNQHYDVFFNTKPWDLHPYALPEGHGTTPFEGYQWWPKTWSLGAAMRLTAFR
jgi:hypothetical protein